jgi:hypothetical protein
MLFQRINLNPHTRQPSSVLRMMNGAASISASAVFQTREDPRIHRTRTEGLPYRAPHGSNCRRSHTSRSILAHNATSKEIYSHYTIPTFMSEVHWASEPSTHSRPQRRHLELTALADRLREIGLTPKFVRPFRTPAGSHRQAAPLWLAEWRRERFPAARALRMLMLGDPVPELDTRFALLPLSSLISTKPA